MRKEVFLSRPSLPMGVSIQQVYGDFIRFLYEAARDYLLLTAFDGNEVWHRLKDHLVLVLAIPNAWEFDVQAIIRDAVRAADIGSSDIQFVTEAEAAVHYVLHRNGDRDWLQAGTNFLVIDAGGSTVDSTLYTCAAATPQLNLKEACIPICQQAGAIFVDYEIEKLLTKQLYEIQYNIHDFPEILSNLVRSFERDAKRRFDGTQERLLVNSGIFNLSHQGFVKGKLGLTNSQLKEAFDSPIGVIVSRCQSLVRTPDRSVSVRTTTGFLCCRVLNQHPAVGPRGWVWRIAISPKTTTCGNTKCANHPAKRLVVGLLLIPEEYKALPYAPGGKRQLKERFSGMPSGQWSLEWPGGASALKDTFNIIHGFHRIEQRLMNSGLTNLVLRSDGVGGNIV
jgi:hypothetical protein